MAHLPRRRHLDVLTELLSPAGKSALDIGCGDGKRWFNPIGVSGRIPRSSLIR